MKKINLPLTEEVVRSLRIGDEVELSGRLYTGRDAFHKYAVALSGADALPFQLAGGVLYHCGPIVVREGDDWRLTAAGPTTSVRTEPYVPELIERFGLRGIIGKGGMGEGTLAACRRFGAVYFSACGGCAQLLAAAVSRVGGVFFLEEFGSPEAVWELEIRDMPLLVSMDSNGGNLHAETRTKSFATAESQFL